MTKYLEIKSTDQVLAGFARMYPQRAPPNKATIHTNVRKFIQTGTVQNHYKGNSGKSRTARTAGKINAVQNAVQNKERMSCRNYNININQNNLWRKLRGMFGQRVIAMDHTVEWPARSPDLTPCDFFLWRYLKQKVYTLPVADLNNLRQRIIDEMNALRGDR